MLIFHQFGMAVLAMLVGISVATPPLPLPPPAKMHNPAKPYSVPGRAVRDIRLHPGSISKDSIARAEDQSATLFNLRSKLVQGSASHDGLYVTTWHTGAGLADAVLLPEPPMGEIGSLAGVQIMYQLGNDSSYPPAYLRLAYEPYASWGPVTLDQSEGPMQYGGFYFNNTANDTLGRGLKFNGNWPQGPPSGKSTQGWGGWYACDWWHNVPQLFWIIPEGSADQNITSQSCSKIELIRQFVTNTTTANTT